MIHYIIDSWIGVALLVYATIVVLCIWEACSSASTVTNETDEYFRLRNKKLEDVALEKLVDEISFKLLATRKHSDWQWLKEKLKK